MTREQVSADPATDLPTHDPVAPQEQGHEADIFTREAEAKRVIHDSAGALMERLRPGKPFRLVLDVQRGEREPDSAGFYRAFPQGTLYLYTEVDQRAGEHYYEIGEAMIRPITLDGRRGGPVDSAKQVEAAMISENFLGNFQDGEARTNDHHDGLRFRLARSARQEEIDPRATDERVVAIQEILGRALQEVVGRLEASQQSQEANPSPVA